MKVLLVNGSPHERGCTFTALSEVAKTLQENGVEPKFSMLAIILCAAASPAAAVLRWADACLKMMRPTSYRA